MPTPLEVSCASVLYAAASSTFGIVVRTNDPTKARAAIYRFRNTLSDPELASLSIRVSPENSEGAIWILNGKRDGLTVSMEELAI